MINTWVGDEALVKVNNETDREDVHMNENKAYEEIEETLGIKPVRFMYELKGMEFDGYEIDTIAKSAILFYRYKDTIVFISMRKDEDGMAKGSIKDGNIDETFTVNTEIGKVAVTGIEGTINKKYMAEFIYDNTYYHIYGELPREEFVNLVGSIFF
ncbi:MAG: DUF4367 domain-containing protein [Lachnospiraceae bacterium]|nr:DUF4367 domain-containing protein [Lachnospiraceae bacterium]